MSRNKAPFVPYAVILLSVIACMCCAALFHIFAQTFAQRMTPGHLPGKAASLIMVMSICSLPTGLAVCFWPVASLVIAVMTGIFLKKPLPEIQAE